MEGQLTSARMVLLGNSTENLQGVYKVAGSSGSAEFAEIVGVAAVIISNCWLLSGSLQGRFVGADGEGGQQALALLLQVAKGGGRSSVVG